MKLFFEAGTVSAADESVAAHRRVHLHEMRERRRSDEPVPVKPVIMEWDEWALSFQSEPVTIDYGKQAPDDAPTTQDLISSSGVRLHAPAQAETPETQETETARSTSGAAGRRAAEEVTTPDLE